MIVSNRQNEAMDAWVMIVSNRQNEELEFVHVHTMSNECSTSDHKSTFEVNDMGANQTQSQLAVPQSDICQ